MLQLISKILFVAFVVLMQEIALGADQDLVWRYSVRPGDNLINFSKTHLINPDDRKILQQLNQIKNPNYLPAGSTLKVPLSLLKQAPAEAEVALVSGEAFLETSGGLVKLNQGQKLGPGAVLITQNNSKVIVKFADGTLTAMASSTRLVLDALSLYSGGGMVDTKLRLQQGQVETSANPKKVIGNTMQIITPTAIAAVRGTQFRVSTDATSIQQETLEGKVALSAAGDEVAVNKGFGSFAKDGKAPSPPIVLLPAVNTSKLKTQYNSLPVEFDLPEQEGAAAWDGKVFADKHLNQVLAEASSKDAKLAFFDIPDGEYYLSVRAKDKNGLSGYDATHVFNINARPFSPDLTSPLKASVLREPRPVLEWKTVEGAQIYGVEIASDAQFTQIIEKERVQNPRYQVSQDLKPGQYFWRVNSIALASNGVEDVGPSLNSSQFSYKALPPAPDINDMQLKVVDNRVFVEAAPPTEGLRYHAVLHNPRNNQTEVWVGDSLSGRFDFLLKEYGEQVLAIRYMDTDGALGPESMRTFNAPAH